jgi:hypothetical protein
MKVLSDSGYAGNANAARFAGMRQDCVEQLRSHLGVHGEAALNQRDGPGEHRAVPGQNTFHVLSQRQPPAARSGSGGGARHECFSSSVQDHLRADWNHGAGPKIAATPACLRNHNPGEG